MSIIESIEGIAQSISVNHYEKYLDEKLIRNVREEILKYDGLPNAQSILLNFVVDCFNIAQTYILDISRQQHQTSELSISSIALRNALIYFLSEQVVTINHYLHNRTENDESILLVVHFPKFFASLQMIHMKRDFLPCFLQTQDMQELFDETIQPRLIQTQFKNTEVQQIKPLTVYDILSDPLDKKVYIVFTKSAEIVVGKLSYRKNDLNTEVLELVECMYPGKIQPVPFDNIDSIILKPDSSYPEYSLEDVEQMTDLSIFHTILALLQITLNRSFTTAELDTVLEVTKSPDLAHSLINGLSKLHRKECE